MGGSSKAVTVGYKYYVGMHMILCHGPVDRVRRIQVDERDIWIGSRDGGSINIRQPEIFGGESREGGIEGIVDFETGHSEQLPNSYLTSKLGAMVPAFRGVAGFVLRQVYMGLNPYLKPWSFRLQRIHKRQNGLQQWYDQKAEIKIAGAFKQTQSFFFAIDKSTSMDAIVSGSVTRLDIVKQQMTEILDTINTLRTDATVPVNIAICAWGGTATEIRRRNVTTSSINELKSFVNGISTVGSTDFRVPAQAAVAWFSDSANAGASNTFLFVTDGEPDIGAGNPQVIADEAQQIMRGLLDRTTADVNCYGINVDIENTQYTAMLDNTANDAVPIVKSDDTTALYNAVFFALLGDSSAMNPAHIIRECLTDPQWGMGYLDSDMDDESFTKAADQLYAESMGISILWDTQTSIEEFVKLIARHIDATLYVDRITGRFVLKLIRKDYVEANLISLNESNIDTISDFVRPAFGELTNSVTVTYWNAANGSNSTLTVQDIALSQQQGATINTSVSYEGFADPITASKAAQRDLKALSTPMASCTIVANEIAKDLNIGSVFKLSWKDYDISNLVMRVTSIAFGDGKSNKIRITCAQDVFATPSEAFIATPPVQWEDPTQAPAVATAHYAFEVPYLELVQREGQSTVDGLLSSNPDAGYVAAAASRPTSGMVAARLYTNDGSGYQDVSNLDFAPGAKLNENIDKLKTTFAIIGFIEPENVTLGSWFQLGSELMSVEAFTQTSITVKRGVLDTVPVAHNSGDFLVFWDVYAEADPTEYVASDTVGVKILTNSGAGQLQLAISPEDVVLLKSRAIRPYPPGNFKINGEYFPNAVIGAISITWAHRNRKQQTGGVLIGFSDTDVTPEDGTTYRVEVYDAKTNTLAFVHADITGTSDSFAVADLRGYTKLEIKVFAVRGGYDSFMAQSHAFDYSAGDNVIQFEAGYTPDVGNSVNLKFKEKTA